MVAESAIASASGCNCIREIAIIPFLVVIVVIIFYDQEWNIIAQKKAVPREWRKFRGRSRRPLQIGDARLHDQRWM